MFNNLKSNLQLIIEQKPEASEPVAHHKAWQKRYDCAMDDVQNLLDCLPETSYVVPLTAAISSAIKHGDDEITAIMEHNKLPEHLKNALMKATGCSEEDITNGAVIIPQNVKDRLAESAKSARELLKDYCKKLQKYQSHCEYLETVLEESCDL